MYGIMNLTFMIEIKFLQPPCQKNINQIHAISYHFPPDESQAHYAIFKLSNLLESFQVRTGHEFTDTSGTLSRLSNSRDSTVTSIGSHALLSVIGLLYFFT